MKSYWILLAAFGIAGCDFVPGGLVEDSKSGISGDEGSADKPPRPPEGEAPIAQPDRCTAEYVLCTESSPPNCTDCKLLYEACVQAEPEPYPEPMPPSCWDDVNKCHDELATQCGMREWSPECDELKWRCHETEQKCIATQTPPPSVPCDDAAATACYDKYQAVCAMEPEAEHCVDLLNQCGSYHSDCYPTPLPPMCDSSAADGCYAKYKDVCATQPEGEDCQALLKDCDTLSRECQPPEPPLPPEPPTSCEAELNACQEKAQQVCQMDQMGPECGHILNYCSELKGRCYGAPSMK